MPANISLIINLFDVSRTHFVQDAYAVILGREPDPDGNATYEKLLGTGAGRLRRKIIMALATSPEARACSPFLPMIAREAVHMQRWHLLPWNRSAIAFAAAQVESQSLIEALTKSVERKLSSVEEKLPRIQLTIDALIKPVDTKLSSVERKLPLIEHTIDVLTKSVDTKLSSIEGKLPLIEHTIEAFAKSVERKLSSIEEKLPLIEHTMRSMKGISFGLQRLENKLDEHGLSQIQSDPA